MQRRLEEGRTGPRLSVCIPAARASTLEHAIRSVLRQDFQDWELLVVGQGENDGALRDMTSTTANGDARVRYVHLDKRGTCAARNAGSAASVGEIVAFMDDDCEADVGWLTALDDCFDPDISMVCGAVQAPPKDSRRFSVCPEADPSDVVFTPYVDGRIDFPPGYAALGCNIAVRRAETHRVMFDESLGPGSQFGSGEDHDFIERLALSGIRMHATPKAIVHHTYGRRYGIRAVYARKRFYLRGDGALAGKRALQSPSFGEMSVRKHTLSEARSQLTTFKLLRIPNNLFRLYHYLQAYRECVSGYDVTDPDPVTALLIPKAEATAV